MNGQQEYIFNDLRDDIVESLNKRMNDGIITIPRTEKYTLVDGFFFNYNIPTFKYGTLPLGGSSAVVSIALVGENSGQIYHFALKTILPNLFNDEK